MKYVFVLLSLLSLVFAQEKTYEIRKFAIAAFKKGEYKKSQELVLEMLQLANNKKHWDYGNTIFHGNMILGRIALRKGEVEKAKKYLLLSAKSKGSPQLNSFGPNMLLAKELIEKGELKTVIEFFDLCKKFWRSERGRLDRWKAKVQAGEIPKFRMNLLIGGWGK